MDGMSYFIVLIFVLMLGVDMSYLLKRGFGQTAAVANFTVIFMLYLGGLFADMRTAMYVFLAAALLLTAYAGYKVIRQRDVAGIKAVFANPAFYLYALLGFAFGIAFLCYVPTATDEMTHWALVVKNMFAYGDFGNLGNSTTMFNQYVPATGIFMFAFQIFGSKFSCGALYAAFDLLAVSLVLPIFEMFKNKKSLTCILCAAVVFLLPMLFKHSMYTNLLVDGILGLMMAHIFLAYKTDCGRADGFTIASIALGCFVLTSTKSSGVALAIFAIIFIAIDAFTLGRQNVKKFFEDKRNYAFVLLPVVLIAFAKLSWSWYVDFYDVRAGWDASEMTMANILEWIKAPTDYQSQVTSLFFKTFFVGNIKYEGGLQLPQVLTLLLVVIACVLLGFKTKNKAFAITQGVVTAVVMVGYGVSLLLLYIFSFAYWEGLTLASYARYNMTVMLGITLIYFYIFVDLYAVGWSEKPIGKGDVAIKLSRMIAPISIAVYCVAAFSVSISGYFIFGSKAAKADAPYEQWNAAVSSLEKGDSVYIVVYDGDGVWDQAHQYIKMRFMATPLQTSGYLEGGSYTDGRDAEVCYTGNPFSMDFSVEKLTEEISGYSHVYLHDVWDGFVERFGILFDDEIKDDMLYKITIDGTGQVKLVIA